MVSELEEEDSKRFRQAPQVGLRKVTSTGDLGAGGFVIRGVVGVDKQTGAVAVSDQVSEGMELQFHARDHNTAHQDLSDTLGLASSLYPASAGALLFTCTGRGQGLFGRTNHDAGLASTFFPETAVAGMFAAGEIGSVCGMPYIHGFSVSMGLLVEREG
jgi:small ligand-binding sensory domain FIST